VRESDLRKYVRKEIILQESSPGDLAYSDVKEIFDAFKNVFTVAGIALKGIASALVLNVEVFFETDLSKMKGHFNSYDGRLARINSEYRQALAEADKAISDFSPILFLTNPAAYAAFHIADSYADNYAATRDFLGDIGIESGASSWLRGSDKDLTQRLLDFLAGKTTKSGEGLANTLEKQKTIRTRLDSLFGAKLSESAASHPGRLSEASEEKAQTMNLADQLDSFIKKTMPKVSSEAFGISKESASAVVDLKKREAEEFAKILESPAKFLSLLRSAKSLEDVKSAVATLQQTPFIVGGIDKITPDSLEKSARSAVSDAKKKKKVADLLKVIGLQEEPKDEESLIAFVKAYQLRNLLGHAVVKSSEGLSKQIEEMRATFLKKFEEDAPLELVSKVAPGSDLETAMKEGIEKIRNAGKRRQEA
jgi:hypothetical protein